ncbi:MAG: DUF2442 domain-containing protein [Burkholderiales bacterium]|nr:DUF2442 domain-containing protein [Burkholderiales bacterium]
MLTCGRRITSVPTVIANLRGYPLFFFGIDRREPTHAGACVGQVLDATPGLARSRNFRHHELNEVAKLVEEHREEIERKWHDHFGNKLEPLAIAASFTGDALRVVLADGQEVSAPLQWFPRLLHATPEQRSGWELIGEGIGIHWPRVDEDIEVASLLAT